MAEINAVYQIDNGSTYDEYYFKTKASQVFCEDGKDLETKFGEIVSTGTNSKGRWVRFSDGTQICFMSLGQTFPITNSWGVGFSATMNTGDFPVAFSQKPMVFGTATGNIYTAYLMIMLARNVSTTYGGDLDVWSPTKHDSPVDQYVNYMAIGRWK